MNSPLYTFYTPITSILQGITVLGIDRLKGIATTVGVRTYLSSSIENPALHPVWRHSLACAFLAEMYVGQNSANKGAAYTAGIMHDIGRVVLAIMQPEEYAKFLESGQKNQQMALIEEKELFGLDHCEVGLQLIIGWELPGDFVEVVSRHHTASGGVWESKILDAVSFSCRVADAIGFAVAPSLPFSYQELLDDLPKQKADLFPAQPEELALQISRKISAIESGVASEWNNSSVSPPSISA